MTTQSYSIEDIIKILKQADHEYFNSDSSFLSDAEYDELKKHVQSVDSENSYLNKVGSLPKRGSKVKLPYTMGSLDQLYEEDITSWLNKFDLHKERLVLTDKLDGVSVLLIYGKNGCLESAYSRGNGIEGTEISRHIKQIPNVPKKIDRAMGIRGEIIISKYNFCVLQEKIKTKANKPYKNARNMMSGLINADINDPEIYQYIDVVVYDIYDCDLSKLDQLSLLKNNGFDIIHSHDLIPDEVQLDAVFLEKHITRRKLNKYVIDGIVIDVDSYARRKEMTPTKDTLNPGYAVKYKILDSANIALGKVKEVEYNISKHGFLKPRVVLEPVELDGVTITYATGFNAKFIYDNRIGPGADVKIIRSGDVIPHIQAVISPAQSPQMPDCEWEWNETKVDAIISNPAINDEVIVKRLIDFFTTLDVSHLGKGNVQRMVDSDLDTLEAIINASCEDISNAIGSSIVGEKIYKSLHEKLQNIECYKLAGAFSNERGIGQRKMKKIEQTIGIDRMLNISQRSELDQTTIQNIEGFNVKTANRACIVLEKFKKFVEVISEHVSFFEASSSVLADEFVVFTGFRDSSLQKEIEDQGATVQSSVTKQTTIVVTKDPDSSSGKIKKAKEKGCKVMGIEEFKEYIKR